MPCAAQFKAAFVQTRRTSAGMQGQLAAMGRYNSTQQLAELACPTLVTCGDRDAVVPPCRSGAASAFSIHLEKESLAPTYNSDMGIVHQGTNSSSKHTGIVHHE